MKIRLIIVWFLWLWVFDVYSIFEISLTKRQFSSWAPHPDCSSSARFTLHTLTWQTSPTKVCKVHRKKVFEKTQMEENIVHCATLMDLKHLKILELRKTCIKNSKTVLYYVPTFWRRTQTLILCSPSGDLPRRTWQSSTCWTIFCNFQKAQDKQTTQYRRKNVEWWCPFVMILLPRSRYSKIIG